MDRNALTVIDGDARVSCRHLQEVLGYSAVRHVHDLIRRNRDELEDYGGVFAHESKNPSAKGGRPITTYYLNEHQATAVCLWAETPKARAARKLIVEVFTAWRKGELESIAAPQVDLFQSAAVRAGQTRDQLLALRDMPDVARNATHLPVWRSGRRPPWWGNYELRAYLTESHRQMTLAECAAECERRFGLSPSIAGLQRYWAKLDAALGHGRAA
ncbi:MAG: hypothetical protein HC783_13280 [Rhodobacteraceae bacterium]|nr:hypothetical protein [Paracoccaceae bacterium]